MTLEQIANGTEIGKQVFKALGEKQRARRATDLTNLFREISKKDKTIQERDVISVFQKLQDAGQGVLVIGRRSNHNRFIWSYNLKHVALVAKGKMRPDEMEEVVKSTGKRKLPKAIRKTNTPILKKTVKQKAASSNVGAPEVVKVEEKNMSKGSTIKPQDFHFSVQVPSSIRKEDLCALFELIESLNK